MSALPESAGLLILPHLRIQNANAISSPLTHGFPSITAFLGLMWALERKLAGKYPVLFDGVGVICHAFQEQVTDGGYTHAFRLTRNPVDKDGSTAAIVEEGRIHLDITLVFGLSGNIVNHDDGQRDAFAREVADAVSQMRVAGGSVLPSARAPWLTRPQCMSIAQDAGEAASRFRQLRRRWLPGFALVCRDDLLHQRTAALQAIGPTATALDAWLDLSRFNWRPQPADATGNSPPDGASSAKVEWRHDRSEGWIVPIPVGYGALSALYPRGEVAHARDPLTPFRFVESLYSIGQWLSPHRLQSWRDLLWYGHTDVEAGVHRARNDYTPALSVFPN
jgi:CRISPR-associated protein Csy2